MRVYIISANWGQGGPGGIAADLYNVLEEDGHVCRFAGGRGTVPGGVDSFRIGTKLDVYLHAAGARLFDNAGFMSGRATEGLIRDIRQFRPDVISLHNPLGYTMHVEKLFRFIRESGIPTFWTLHDCWAVAGHCAMVACDRYKTGCGECPKRGEFPKSLLLDRSRENLRRKKACLSGIPNLRLIAPSAWIKGIFADSYMGNYPITVIYNGIDLSDFAPAVGYLRREYGLEKQKIVLAAAGVWGSRKGGKYLPELAERLGDEFTVVVIGKGAERYTAGPNMLHFRRTDSRRQLAEWYTTADVFVNPTEGDNFPTVNLEALACGTPVVTYDTGGSGESVGQCGEIVEAGNVEALAQAVRRTAERHIPLEACRERAYLFDKWARYGDYMRLFQQTVDERG